MRYVISSLGSHLRQTEVRDSQKPFQKLPHDISTIKVVWLSVLGADRGEITIESVPREVGNVSGLGC
jgi:hypothetical protein